MIGKREVLAIARKTSLTPHVVEKDYVLGWMLAGIFGHEDLRESWLFKVGTCLKKCFFETYRFPDNLDFKLLEPRHLDADFLTGFGQCRSGNVTERCRPNSAYPILNRRPVQPSCRRLQRPA